MELPAIEGDTQKISQFLFLHLTLIQKVLRMKLVKVIFPRFRKLQEEFRLRDEFYALAKEEREALRLERLNAIWKKALKESAYYSNVYLTKKKKLPGCFRTLEEYKQLVPVTPKAAVRENPRAFKLLRAKRGIWMSTGGSTGTPLSVFWALPGHLDSLRDQYWARLWWGVDPFDRQAMLWGHSHSFGSGLSGTYHKVMVPVIDKLRGRKRFSAYYLDANTLQKYYDVMARFRPKSIYAYASAAHLLALANKGRPLFPEKPNVAFLAAEPILRVYRESVTSVFGCPCAGEYGSIECGMIAYEHPDGAYRVFERSVIVETVKREGGYAILITQLRDTDFPLFRYDIGDMSSAQLSYGPNGRELLSDIRGRSHDLIRSPSGRVCHGEMLTHIIERVPSVILFTVRQRRDYSLSISIQTRTGKELSKENKKWIKEEIRKILGDRLNLNIKCVSQLKRTLAGKHRWVISELDS